MAHKTLVGGTSYELKGGKTLVDGTEYQIKKGRTLVDGTGYDILFNIPLADLQVGDSVFINENGSLEEYFIVHQGKPADFSYFDSNHTDSQTGTYDDSCYGTWLLRRNIAENRKWHSSTYNNYAGSTINTYLNDTFITRFDSDVQSLIKQVKLPYMDCGSYEYRSMHCGSDGVSTKIFLLSIQECGCPKSSYDGSKLAYFNRYDTTAGADNSQWIAYLNGTTNTWFTRSPYMPINGTESLAYNYVWTFETEGGLWNYGVVVAHGIRPALILPMDAVVDSEHILVVE